jgi:hypothetical protein
MNFSDLPPELRQDIWTLTFEPRILCIHMYRRIAPKCSDQNEVWEQLDDRNRMTLAVSFTCTALNPQRDENIVPNDVYQERANMLPQSKRFKLHDMDALKKLGTMSPGPTSLGPVALYVCSESRAVGTKRYEFAFKGKNIALIQGDPDARADWHRRKLGERGIWVDFERDIVFIDSIAPEDRRSNVLSPTLMYTELGWFTACAKEEAKKIKRLAVGGRWSKVPHIKRTLDLAMYKQVSRSAQSFASVTIRSFQRLRELLLDDGFKQPRTTYPQVYYPEVQYGIEEDRQQGEAKLLSWLLGDASRIERSPKPCWGSLEVRIVRGGEKEWNDL